jgi:hypothetical protein
MIQLRECRSIFLLSAGIFFCIGNRLFAQTLVIEEFSSGFLNGVRVSATKKSIFMENYVYIDDSMNNFRIFHDIRKKRVLLVDDKNKSATSMSCQKFLEYSRSGISGFGVLSENDLEISETADRKTIRNIRCRKMIISIKKLGMRIEYWVGSPRGVRLDSYFAYVREISSKHPFEMINRILFKRQEYPIEGHVVCNAGSIVTECVDIRITAKSNLLPDVPSDYTLITLPE